MNAQRLQALVPLGLAAALLALVAGLAVCEWQGWPFLQAPLQRLLSQQLDRRVMFSPDTTAGAADGISTGSPNSQGFGVRFGGGLRLVVQQLQIAAPAWSSAPHMVLARDVSLQLRYVDVWRAYRGQPLNIQRLQAAELDAHLERLADGRASWQFGPNAWRAGDTPLASSPPPPMPTFGHLQLAAGVVRYNDVPLAVDTEAHWSLAESNPASVLTLNATGHYRKLPVKIELTASSPLPRAADAAAAASYPVSLNAAVGRASLQFKGTATDALHGNERSGFNGRFSLMGPSLAAVGDPLGVTLPTTSAFRTEGVVDKEGSTWRVLVDDATVGASRLTGAFVYEGGGRVPLLSGRLGGKRLLLVDLGPVVGTTPAMAAAAAPASAPVLLAAANKSKGMVLPDRPFDLAALRAMDANVLIDIGDVDLNTRLLEPLRPLRTHLQLAGGVLTLRELDARTAQGRLMGDLALDGRGTTALWKAELRWDGVRLERWIHQTRADGAPPYVSGELEGQASLQGQGRSTAEILASLKGQARSELRGGAVSHLAVEAAGLDVAQGLGLLFKGDDALPVQCAVADLVASDGVFRPRAMVLDTPDSAIWVDGSLSLATEALDLRAVVVPKDFSPLTLRTPLRVRGSFAQPEVSVDKGPAGKKLAASILLGLLNPLAALIPLVDPGDADGARRGAAGCKALRQRSTTKRAAATTTR